MSQQGSRPFQSHCSKVLTTSLLRLTIYDSWYLLQPSAGLLLSIYRLWLWITAAEHWVAGERLRVFPSPGLCWLLLRRYDCSLLCIVRASPSPNCLYQYHIFTHLAYLLQSQCTFVSSLCRPPELAHQASCTLVTPEGWWPLGMRP